MKSEIYFWQYNPSQVTNITLLQHFLQQKLQVLFCLPTLYTNAKYYRLVY